MLGFVVFSLSDSAIWNLSDWDTLILFIQTVVLFTEGSNLNLYFRVLTLCVIIWCESVDTVCLLDEFLLFVAVVGMWWDTCLCPLI